MTRAQLHALLDAQYDDGAARAAGSAPEPTYFSSLRTSIHSDLDQPWPTSITSQSGESTRKSSKKNGCQTRFGAVEVAHTHRFKAKTNGFSISPHLQELMAIAGVSDVYSVSNDLLNTFLGLEIAISQVYRVSPRYLYENHFGH